MALQTATNPQTGDRVALVGGEWKPITQTATNKAGARAYLVGSEWVVDEAPAPAPAQRSTPVSAPEPTQPLLSGEFDAGLPTTGTGTEPAPAVGKEPGPAKRAPYKSRVEMLDDAVNLLEEGVDREEMKQSLQKMGVKFEDVIKHGQKRGSSYFKQQAIAPAPSVAPTARKNADGIKATPDTEFLDSPVQYSAEAVGSMFKRVDASLGDVATSYLLQSGAVDAEGAGRLLARNAKQRAANAPSSSIRAGMQEIGNAETYGDAISAMVTYPRATFTLLAESVLTSLPGMVPSLVLGPAGVIARSGSAGVTSGGMEYGSAMADVLQEKRINMLDPNAVAKALADPKIMAEIKDKGAKRGLIVGVFDGLSMGLAGRFLKPAQALIAEGKLAGSAATKATMAAWGKELTTQMAGGAGGELAAQKATGDDKPADVLLEAGASIATAPLEARANLRESRLAEQQAAINKELAAPPPPGRIEPTLDETALVPPASTVAKEPSAAVETTAVIAQKQRADRIVALTQVLELQGIPTDNAERIATRKVDSELKAEAKTAAIKIPEGRVEEITQELIASGVPPQQAKIDAQALAQEEAQADELAQTEAGGTPDVARPISEPIGASTALAKQPSAEPTAAGVGDNQRDGMVPAGPATTDTAVGEGAQPTALKPQPVDATLYHGTNAQYENLDPEKSGGMVFFGENLSTAERYAQNGGGGRARLDNTQKYIVDRNGVTYELDGETWKAVGIAPEGGLINKDTIQPLDKAYPSLSQAEAEEMTNPDSGTAGVVPKTSRVITQDFSGLKLLDISTPEGRNVIAGLTPSTQVGSGLVEAAKFDAQDKTDRNSTTQLNSNFWSLTKYSSAYGDQLKKDIIGPLKAMGYDGIRFSDDQHSSVGLFDTGLDKEKPSAKATLAETPAETSTLTAEEELDKKSAAETRSLPFDELQAKIKEGASAPGAVYTATYNETDTDLEGNRVTTPVSNDYKVVRMDGGWTVISNADGSKPVLLPPSRAAANTDEQLVAQQSNRLQFVRDTTVTPKGTTTDGTATTETVQTETQKQETPAAGAVTKSKRGRPPSPHVVVENAEGGFDHVLNGEVLGSYANQKQATAAANLAKAQDKGDAALIAKNQAKLDAALASTGRGRPKKAAPEDGAPALDNEAKSEIAELESALETYNSTTDDLEAKHAAMYIAEVANDTSLPKAVRDRAQQMLDEDVDPKDLPKSLRSSDAKVGKADTGFSKLTNGSQAIAHIIKTGNFFQRFVAQRIRNFLVGVKFVVLERGDSIPAEMDGARGLFVYTPGTKERTVYVRGASFGGNQGINNITVLHELLHAATAQRIEAGLLKGFKNASLQKFMREMESLMKRAQEAYEEAEVFGDLSPEMQELVANTTDIDKKTGRPVLTLFTDPHEFLAYGMSNPDFQRFLMGVQGKRNELTGFAKFVADIRDLFGIGAKDATAFTDLVDITDKMLRTRLTPVKTKRTALPQKGKFTPPDFDEQADLRAKRSATTLERDALKAKQKVAESREGDVAEAVKAMQNARDPSKVRDILARAWSGMSYLQREAAVRLPTFDFLSRWAAENGISSLRQTNLYLERMLGMSQQFLVGSEQMIGMLNRGFKEDKNLSRKQFENFVYATTIAEMDPSDPNAVERSKNLDADYKALGPVGQRMYKDLRNYYESIIELYSDLLDDQIQNARGLSQEDKNNLMATLRKTFEAKARIRPYFPLVRRGDFWLAIGSGDRRRFYTFESRGDRNAKAAELAAGRGDDIEDLLFRQEFTQGNNLGELRMASKDSSQMLKQTFDAIDRMEMGDDTLGVGSAREGLKDAVYQIYLNTMPEQTFRKQFTHRKNVIGFSTDIQQNIATTASKQAIQLSRLKYAPCCVTLCLLPEMQSVSAKSCLRLCKKLRSGLTWRCLGKAVVWVRLLLVLQTRLRSSGSCPAHRRR